MVDSAKQAQVAERIRTLTATAVRGLKDPRVGMVTITDARVTPDLREATLFYTVFGSDEEVADTAKALKSSRGHLRTTVGKALGMRHVPTITFVADTVPEQAGKITSLLSEANKRDEELRKAREGAAYAGDANPYVDDSKEDAEADAADSETKGSS